MPCEPTHLKSNVVLAGAEKIRVLRKLPQLAESRPWPNRYVRCGAGGSRPRTVEGDIWQTQD